MIPAGLPKAIVCTRPKARTRNSENSEAFTVRIDNAWAADGVNWILEFASRPELFSICNG